MSHQPTTDPPVPLTPIKILSPAFQELQSLNLLPSKALEAIETPDGLGILVQTLKSICPPASVIVGGPQQRAWECVGLVYRYLQRFHEALSIFRFLYYQMLQGQQETGARCHKGTPLCWISDCYFAIGYPLMSLRYLMLTLVEDAITTEGRNISPQHTGVYWRTVFRGWLSEQDLNHYAREFHALGTAEPTDASFPEAVLQKLGHTDWLTFGPTPAEAGTSDVNVLYLQHLATRLGEGSGKILERLAEYLLTCMPGCRTARRLHSNSTDYDVVCAMEGLESDFRSELGRYFICECKDWATPADFTTFAKLCRVLDSVKARFGILFSRHGISGTGRREDADLEQLKVYQDRGMVIVVFTRDDIQRVIDGTNFISLLRRKYEKVRLNLSGETERK